VIPNDWELEQCFVAAGKSSKSSRNERGEAESCRGPSDTKRQCHHCILRRQKAGGQKSKIAARGEASSQQVVEERGKGQVATKRLTGWLWAEIKGRVEKAGKIGGTASRKKRNATTPLVIWKTGRFTKRKTRPKRARGAPERGQGDGLLGGVKKGKNLLSQPGERELFPRFKRGEQKRKNRCDAGSAPLLWGRLLSFLQIARKTCLRLPAGPGQLLNTFSSSPENS